MEKETLNKIVENFLIEEVKEISPISTGNINGTYRVKTVKTDYLLQKINKNVFKRPNKVMENITQISIFLQEKILNEGGDINREVLQPKLTHER